jgi:hypothetical protein
MRAELSSVIAVSSAGGVSRMPHDYEKLLDKKGEI